MRVDGLKTLEEHNEAVANIRKAKHRHNGIACPVCGHALMDTGLKLLLDPPKYKTFCSNDECDYTGTRS